jgi:hypothetical protein
MGTSFFKGSGKGFQPSGMNLEARAGAAGGYASKAAGGTAAKDLGAAQAMYLKSKLSPTKGTAAANAPGPKKV